jgi:hypothetical protein
MSGLRKTTIAKEAIRQLDGLYDLAHEGRSFAFHANSANNYIKAIIAVGWDLPEKIRRNWSYLHTQGWRM